MVRSPSLEEENIMKDVGNLFRLNKLWKETNDVAIKDLRNLFSLENKNKAIKDTIIRDIRNLFEYEEDYYRPVRVGNCCGNNYIEHKSKDDRKTLSVEEYFNKIRWYLKDILNNIENSNTWKTQLTVAINFISSKNKDEERVVHSKSDNIEIMINDKADEDVKNDLILLLKNIQLGSKHQWEVVISSLILIIYYIINAITQIRIVVDHILILLTG